MRTCSSEKSKAKAKAAGGGDNADEEHQGSDVNQDPPMALDVAHFEG